jgi:class 3 adenylate cyclase/tetratricopeptide (TPR) repeat protein
MSSIRPPERRQLTVMLCDLVGWSALSLRLDAEELTELIQAYRQRCTILITSHGGIVAQYVGDGILAYFGYPRAHEDDAERAIRAALSIAASERSSSEISNVHIGIATGIVVVGNLLGDETQPPKGGAEQISAVGSALNLAARLQALAGPGMVIVSEQTRRLSRGIFEYQDLGRHDLKGFDKPVQAWQAIGESRVWSRFHALRASTLTPLVDRRSELQELRRLWDSVQAGQGRALLLSSEPGVGKSRLAEEVARQIVDRRCLRLWYYCSPHLQSSPLAPLIRQLTRAAGFRDKDDDDSKLRKLARLIPTAAKDTSEIVPLLANLLSIQYESKYAPLNMSPQRQKHRLFQVLMNLLEVFASGAPVLLVVEDLHWIDPSSDELIGTIIDRLKELPILVVLTARLEFHSHWNDRAHALHMHLSPLDRGDSIAMIELLCGNRNVPESTVGQIADKTDGLPLFIEDLTRDVLELADLQETGSGVATQPTPAPFAIPTTLTDSLMSRLDRLGSAKAVAQIGAAIGREFSYELLAKVAELPEEKLKEEMYRLVDAGLLTSHRSTAVLMYTFKHALVRDAAYSSLLKKGQVSLHSRIARILVEDFPETAESQPEVLAYHFEAAKDIDNAVRYLVKAAKLSAKRSGFVEAIAQLERALSLLDTQGRSRGRMQQELRVYLALGGINAEYRGFSSAECGDAYTAALDRCRELGDAPEIFSVLSGVGSFEITRASFRKCRALAEECLSRAAQQESKPPFVMGHLLLGGTLFLTGELTAAREHLEEALLVYEQHQTSHRGKQVLYVQDQKSTGLCYLALTLTILGYLDSGLRAAENGLSHSQSLGGPHTINFSLCYLAAVHHIQRDGRKALERATQSLESAREQGFATWIGPSQTIVGASLISNREYEAGLKEISRGIHAYSEMEAAAYQPFWTCLYAQGFAAAGKLDEALGALDQALAISERTGERFYLTELQRQKGEVLIRKGSLAEGEYWLREAIELSRQQEAKLFELRSAATLCRLLDGPGKEAALRDMLEPVYSWFEEGLDAPDLEDARALLR